MKKVDTLIVGFGLAGLAYAETLTLSNKTFHVIDAESSGSSAIAAGIYNPTVLKRFNMTWKGEELHAFALPFYQTIEKKLQHRINFPAPIFKLFGQASDHNQWAVAADRAGLSLFLDATIHSSPIAGVKSPYGYGKLNACGRIDTRTLIEVYRNSIANYYQQASFDYSAIEQLDNGLLYKGIHAQHIVFCEGYAMTNNPFFNGLPLVGSKGQILIINAPELQREAILKGPIFIAPLGDDLYWAGASFEQKDKTLATSPKGKAWLVTKIEQLIDVPYTIEEHLCHIRPTVLDRRPLLGTHKKYKNIHLLNGLGSRGVLTAPLAAKWLYDSIHEGIDLPREVDINRFKKIT